MTDFQHRILTPFQQYPAPLDHEHTHIYIYTYTKSVSLENIKRSFNKLMHIRKILSQIINMIKNTRFNTTIPK